MMDEMKSKGASCPHCGGMVDEDGLAIVLADEPVTEESISEEADMPKRDFADAVMRSKGGR